MALYFLCRGAGIKTWKWAAHLLMDVYCIIVAERIGAVEDVGGITKGPPDTSLQGALNVAFPRPRDNEETIGICSGVERPRRHRIGLYPRRTLIVVSTFTQR